MEIHNNEGSNIECFILTSSSVSSISEVYSIEELKERQKLSGTVSGVAWKEDATPTSQAQSFTGILYAYLTHLNITGDSSTVVSYRW